MTTKADHARTEKPVSAARVVTAACVGNAIEWYDIAVYGYFSVYVAAAYFPAKDPTVSLLLALGTFALSFFIRPIGALVLGSYADRHGRKPALTVTIGLMFVGTLLIVAMPPASVIGLAAPILILLARLIQGFAAGGEFGSATALMMEHMPERRGFAASWQFTSQALSTLLASGVGVWLTSTLSPEDLHSWGFRVPFALGLLVGPVGLYIRRHVSESPEFTAAAAAGEVGQDRPNPVVAVVTKQKILVFLAIGLMAASTCLNYFITYLPTFAMKSLGLGSTSGFWASTVAGLVLLVVTPIIGLYCDRLGRLAFMLPAAVAIIVLAYALFTWVQTARSLPVLIAVVAILSLCKAMYYAPLASVLGDVFPTATRSTGLSFGYNIGVAVFGGLTPLIAAWLVDTTGEVRSPSFWVMATAAMSIGACLLVRKRIGLR